MRNILISRTDNLGDVVLTFPLAAFLKKRFPDSKIIFLGKKYTASLLDACNSIDEFISREEIIENPGAIQGKEIDVAFFVFPDKEVSRICKRAKIKIRIGTSHRLFHWLYANKLVKFSRKKSELHEAQLNFKLLEGLNIFEIPSIETLGNLLDLSAKAEIPETIKEILHNKPGKIILHPKSKGSAREWPLKNYYELAQKLSKEGFSPIITGTLDEGERIRNEMPDFFSVPNLIDFTGKLTLAELISVINISTGLIACSTGPLQYRICLRKKLYRLLPFYSPNACRQMETNRQKHHSFNPKRNMLGLCEKQ